MPQKTLRMPQIQSCCSTDEHLGKSQSHQPYLLAMGRTRGKIDSYYIALDNKLIPCQTAGSLGALDELFKVHCIFNISYDNALIDFYTFLQTMVYNIDVPSEKVNTKATFYGSLSLSDYENGEDLANALQITVQTDIYSTSWTKLDGTEYRPGLAICTEIKHELPVFCKVTSILVLGENVYCLVGKLVTELFS